MSIQVSRLHKSFGSYHALRDVSLEVASGELVALLGPSGSGKTSLLRIIAGLEQPDQGEVRVDGSEAEARHVGFVFQHYALFKHMSVFENVAFGLRVRDKSRRPSEEQIKAKVMELLSLVHLASHAERYPAQLSGGQRQRVALARALAVEPSVLLLDEPFGALDAKVRKELRRFIRRLHEELHITSILVTHDQEEALEIADRVVVMNAGKIEQIGSPEEIYSYPANAFVYDFLGNYNAFSGYRDAAGAVQIHGSESAPAMAEAAPNLSTPRWLERLPFGRAWLTRHLIQTGLLVPESVALPLPSPEVQATSFSPIGDALTCFCRPHEMELSRTPQSGGSVRARITHINRAGALVHIELVREDGSPLEAEIPREDLDALQLKRGDTVFTRPTQLKVF